jgi:hypothetical protein
MQGIYPYIPETNNGPTHPPIQWVPFHSLGQRKSRAIPLLSLWAFIVCSRVIFTFTFTFICITQPLRRGSFFQTAWPCTQGDYDASKRRKLTNDRTATGRFVCLCCALSINGIRFIRMVWKCGLWGGYSNLVCSINLLVTRCTNKFNIQKLYGLPTLYLCVL